MWNKCWYFFRLQGCKRTEFNRMLKILYSEDQQRLVSMKNKNLATIHILKNKLGLSEETYRALLQESYQVNSSKDLSLIQQKELITLLNNQFISQYRANQSSYKQQNYIFFLSKDTVTNLSAYCSKIIKRSINSVKDLSKEEAITIINSLQRYQRGAKSGKNTPVY